MANKIEKTEILPSELVNSLSRYVNSEVIYYGKNNLLTFTTYKRQNIETNQSQDKFTVITSGNEYRPDKLSSQAYGVPDLWWKIMEANGIYDIWDFKTGTNIRLPSDANMF